MSNSGDNKLLARIPIEVYERACHEQWDEGDWARYLNSSRGRALPHLAGARLMAGWDDTMFGNLPRPGGRASSRPMNAQEIAAWAAWHACPRRTERPELARTCPNAVGGAARAQPRGLAERQRHQREARKPRCRAWDRPERQRGLQAGTAGQLWPSHPGGPGRVRYPRREGGQGALRAPPKRPPQARQRRRRQGRLPQVAWDPGQQRWLTDRGKPVTAASTSRGTRPAIRQPLRLRTIRALASARWASQFDLPARRPAKGPASLARVPISSPTPTCRPRCHGQSRGLRGRPDPGTTDARSRTAPSGRSGPDAGRRRLRDNTWASSARPRRNRRCREHPHREHATTGATPNGMPPMNAGRPDPAALWGRWPEAASAERQRLP